LTERAGVLIVSLANAPTQQAAESPLQQAYVHADL
jgi:hypothetical protein